MTIFNKGDRVRWNPKGVSRLNSRWALNALRVGTYISGGRDGKCDRVLWDGATQPRTFNAGYLELANDTNERTDRG